MSRTIENRLQRLEAMQPDTEADASIEFFMDGEFLYAEHNGQTYDAPLEEAAAVMTRVFFVTPPARPDDGEVQP